jgi:uncharacterized coiled-coil DUF342 family protein
MADEKTAETPETPVELKAPPAIKKPDRNVVKDKEEKVRAEMAKLEAKIKVVSDKAKAIQQETNGKDDGLSEARSRLKELKNKREGLISQRTAIYGVRDAARESRDAKMSEMKDLKSQTKFKDVGEIDRNIKKLETMQFTTTMSLAKEKEILKELEDLRKQRRILAQHMAVASDLDGGKTSAVDTGAQIKDINNQLSGIKGEMDKLQAELNKHYDKKNDSKYPKLIKEKDELRAQKKALADNVQKLWDDFKVANKVWKDNQNEWDKYKKLLHAKEKAEEEARRAERKKQREEELAKKTPYEEEMDLCDYLSNYLTTTFLSEKSANDAAASENKTVSEFDGLSLVSSKKSDGDFYMAPSGKQSKAPKKKGGAKGVAGTKRGKIVIFPETLESFGLLKMEPPTTVEQVAETVKALEKKKAEFKVMPRGQIESIAEMNQKYEDAEGNRYRSSGRDNKKSGGHDKKNNKKTVDVSSTELFPTLGGAPKPPAAEAAAEATA